MNLRLLYSFVILIVALALSVPVAAAPGGLSGSAALRYGEYSATENGQTVAGGHSFSQQYSLVYKKAGELLQGRGGNYDLALGYEWNALNVKTVDALQGRDLDADLSTGKVLYRGEATLAPGGLPFRLHVFSRDMNRSLFEEDTSLRMGSDFGVGRERNLLAPRLVDDLSNGSHITTGATLVVGIRNGHYLGRYRDILSSFPRLLMDYSENDVRDLATLNPKHYRDRNLAFVSLNKKDNWFHYRMHDYVDYVNHQGDYTKKTYMLGTVDQRMTRQWINMTNWIKVSADGALTQLVYKQGVQPSEDRVDLNLFVKAVRSNWNAANFTNFSRVVRDSSELDKILEIPIYANGELDRNTAWRFAFITHRRQNSGYDDTPSILSEDKDDIYLKSNLEMFRQSRYIVSPTLELEAKRGDDGEGNSGRAQLEFYSNQKYRPKYDVYGSYSIAYFDGNDNTNQSIGYLENVADGKLGVNVSSRTRVSVHERILLGNGDLGWSMTDNIIPLGESSLVLSDAGQQSRTGRTFRSTTNLALEHSTRSRLRNRLEFVYDMLSSNGDHLSQSLVSHRLDYSGRTLYANMRNQLAWGDDIAGGDFQSTALDLGTAQKIVDTSYSHTSTIRYSPSRTWETSGKMKADWWEYKGGDTTTRFSLGESTVYNFFKVNGMVRKIASLAQEYSWEWVNDAGSGLQTVHAFSLNCNYYPTHNSLLGVKTRYRIFPQADEDDFVYVLVAGLDFQKLKVSVDYGYGIRNGSDDGYDSMPDRKEHRWHVNLEKVF